MALGHAASAPARVWADYEDDDPMDNGDPQEYRGELRSADVHTAADALHATGQPVADLASRPALHFPHWSQMHKGIGKGEARLASHDQPCEFFSSSGLCSRWRRRPRLKGRCGHDRQRLRRAAGASS